MLFSTYWNHFILIRHWITFEILNDGFNKRYKSGCNFLKYAYFIIWRYFALLGWIGLSRNTFLVPVKTAVWRLLKHNSFNLLTRKLQFQYLCLFCSLDFNIKNWNIMYDYLSVLSYFVENIEFADFR